MLGLLLLQCRFSDNNRVHFLLEILSTLRFIIKLSAINLFMTEMFLKSVESSQGTLYFSLYWSCGVCTQIIHVFNLFLSY